MRIRSRSRIRSGIFFSHRNVEQLEITDLEVHYTPGRFDFVIPLNSQQCAANIYTYDLNCFVVSVPAQPTDSVMTFDNSLDNDYNQGMIVDFSSYNQPAIEF